MRQARLHSHFIEVLEHPPLLVVAELITRGLQALANSIQQRLKAAREHPPLLVVAELITRGLQALLN